MNETDTTGSKVLSRTEWLKTKEKQYVITYYNFPDKPPIGLVMELPQDHTVESTRKRQLRVTSKVPAEAAEAALATSTFVITVDCIPDLTDTQRPDYFFDATGQPIGYQTSRPEETEQDLNEPQLLSIDHHTIHHPLSPETVTSTSMAFQLWKHRKELHQTTLLVTHTDPDTILALALVLDFVPVEHVKSVVQAATESDHTGQLGELAQVLTHAEVHNDVALSLQLAQLYFQFQNRFVMSNTSDTQSFHNWLKLNHSSDQNVTSFLKEIEFEESRHQKLSRLFLNQEFDISWSTVNDPEKPTMLAKDGTFKLWQFPNGVVWIDNESDVQTFEYIDSQQLLETLPQAIRSQVAVIVFSRKIPETELWELEPDQREKYTSPIKTRTDMPLFEVKVRSFRPDINLLDINGFDLTESSIRKSKQPTVWSFGGRPEAGSTYRDGGSLKNGHEFAEVISKNLGTKDYANN